MKMHVFYNRIPYSNEKYHKNGLVLARKTELFYFSRKVVGISTPNLDDVCRQARAKKVTVGSAKNLHLHLAVYHNYHEIYQQ